MESYKVYVKTDSAERVTAIDSSAVVREAAGWVLIAEGSGDEFHHAQSNFLPLPLMTEEGIYRYKLAGSALVERTAEEMTADVTHPLPTPSDADRIAALEAAMLTLMEGTSNV